MITGARETGEERAMVERPNICETLIGVHTRATA